MNKTQFKNRFGKYFQQIENSEILCISTNHTNRLLIHTQKNNRKTLLDFNSSIQMCDKGILNFTFECEKLVQEEKLESLYESATILNEVTLFKAEDAFCQEEALQFRYNENHYFYVLIYTNMVESSLEFFNEELTADKFKKVAF